MNYQHYNVVMDIKLQSELDNDNNNTHEQPPIMMSDLEMSELT